MTRRFTLPGWLVTLGTVASTLFGLFIGVASAAWSARSMVDEQTAAIASLRQTLDQTVHPALVEVESHGVRLAGHDTQLAVINQTCCGDKGTSGRSTVGASE